MDFLRSLAEEVAEGLAYAYPDAADDRVSDWVETRLKGM